jgi:hypothetical protein
VSRQVIPVERLLRLLFPEYVSDRERRLSQVKGEFFGSAGKVGTDPRHCESQRARAARRRREAALAVLFGHLPPALFAISPKRHNRTILPLACNWDGDRPTVSDGSTTVSLAADGDGAVLSRDGWVEQWSRGRMVRRWRGESPRVA